MKIIFSVLVSAMAAATTAHAQGIFGSIQGTVADETGAVVPKAHVVARNVATGVESATRSNESGIYFIGELRPGSYDVYAEAAGFSRIFRKGVTLRVEDKLRLDFALKVGQVTDTLEVTSEAPLVQTESNTIGRVVEETTIKQLPLSGRNAFQLVLLVPGTQQRRDDELPRLSGGLARTGEFVLDGSSITTPRRGQLFTQPNLDAIQEFKVQTNGLSAEVGRTAGGIVNATLKSGANGFHGNLYDFLRNNDLNARNFFAATVPKLVQNQYGGMIGGPIRRDHTFFFFDGEGFRTQTESLFNLTLPTTLMKQGDFSELRQQIYDPGSTRQVSGQLTRDPFAGNFIPSSRLVSTGVKAIQLYPDPNRPGTTQNYQRLIPIGADNKKFDVRIDHRLSDQDLIFGRYSLDHQYSDTARPYASSGTGGNRGNFNRYMTGSFNWTRTITPTTLNDLRFAFFRGVQERLLSLGTADLGIPNLNVVGLPQFTVPGYDSLGDSQAFNPAEEQFQLQDSATFVRGRHIIKAGADIRRFRINDLQLQFTASFGLSAVQTALPTSPGTTGSPLASLVLGQADSFANSTLRGRFYYRSWYSGLFVQDDFKVNPALTINIGLRYDVEQEPRETRSQGSIFDLHAGRVTTMKDLGRNYIQFTDKDNWGPRIGFAWRPFKSDRTVVRSHFGAFYVPLTGRATSAFDRFPQDQRIGMTSDGINPAALISQPPPIVFSVDGTGFAHDTKNVHAQVGSFLEWNFDIQRQLLWSMLLQISYAASAGRHLPMNEDWNVIPIAAVQRAGTGTQAMRPYPAYGDILAHDERQTSSYNALQVGLERRTSHGPILSISYTFSKMIDYNEDDFSSMFPMDPYNLRLERGLSQTHFPHHFVAAIVYDLPWGKGRARLNAGPLSWVLGGWQTSGIVSMQSGQQVWITQATNTARTFSRGFRPSLTGDPTLPGDQRTLLRYFNTAAFQAPPPLAIGNSNKFPNIQGPGAANTDFALIRFFPLPWGEQKKLELRSEFFNLFNRANFQPPSGAMGTPTFGRVTAADAPRLVQIGLKFWF